MPHKPRLAWIDQYSNVFYARTLRELRAQIPGRASPMYVDRIDGSTVRLGYVIGKHWLGCFAPVERSA